MMMVPRSFVQNPLALSQRRRSDFGEKEALSTQRSINSRSRSPSPSALSRPLSQSPDSETRYQPSSDPVRIPSRNTRGKPPKPERPAPTTLQIPTSAAANLPRTGPPRRESVQDILSSTTIPIRKKPRQRPAQRLPNCDYVADFSKLLRDDVQSQGDAHLSGSWTNPQFEGLFGNIDGFIEDQVIVGSEGVDASLLSTRSLSSDSMPSLASPDDFSTNDMPSVSPATIRSPADPRLRQVASSEDCSNQHPLLSRDDDCQFSGASTPELLVSSPPKPRRRDVLEQKAHRSFKSSLTASLKALKSAAQTVSNIATTPPLVPPDEFLGASIFEFKPELTDDRRPPPSVEPPSAAMRRYLNPRATMPADSPAQLHFWLDEKPDPHSKVVGNRKPKLKTKKKNQPASSNSSKLKNSRNRTALLPSVVQLSTCIPSTIRTANASSPPTWLEPDGTPSNKHRAAQALTDGTADSPHGEGQPRPREPRENRDFLRVYVCELNMRKCGKLADEAHGHAKLWLPPVTEDNKDKKNKQGEEIEKKTGVDRWPSWTSDDI
ncbi:uncharacterized protein A1O9_08501 [Exophiala aquamarina CBS 119918]|uniref:Uncharacterized protein n=1 Tax=Exophiala aquamarina CBS 119918 TaxID=1182545 RepID=A0A072PJS5_9EURO|nr:uncharacterized protein A1O9_08501 [Exophiala aquamarina CBS 119918]KEF55750.1 hypothetical protein A1O9_08501 [Exophiala aquamarina CBS 119918]